MPGFYAEWDETYFRSLPDPVILTSFYSRVCIIFYTDQGCRPKLTCHRKMKWALLVIIIIVIIAYIIVIIIRSDTLPCCSITVLHLKIICGMSCWFMMSRQFASLIMCQLSTLILIFPPSSFITSYIQCLQSRGWLCNLTFLPCMSVYIIRANYANYTKYTKQFRVSSKRQSKKGLNENLKSEIWNTELVYFQYFQMAGPGWGPGCIVSSSARHPCWLRSTMKPHPLIGSNTELEKGGGGGQPGKKRHPLHKIQGPGKLGICHNIGNPTGSGE